MLRRLPTHAFALLAALMPRLETADTSSMTSVPSITAAGLGLLSRADARLARSAETFTRSAAPLAPNGAAMPETPNADATLTDVVDAAVGVIYGGTAFQIGVTLIAVGRDTEKQLLDILA